MLANAASKEALQDLLGFDVQTNLGARENEKIQLTLLMNKAAVILVHFNKDP